MFLLGLNAAGLPSLCGCGSEGQGHEGLFFASSAVIETELSKGGVRTRHAAKPVAPQGAGGVAALAQASVAELIPLMKRLEV